jgi:hypothetical protein
MKRLKKKKNASVDGAAVPEPEEARAADAPPDSEEAAAATVEPEPEAAGAAAAEPGAEPGAEPEAEGEPGAEPEAEGEPGAEPEPGGEPVQPGALTAAPGFDETEEQLPPSAKTAKLMSRYLGFNKAARASCLAIASGEQLTRQQKQSIFRMGKPTQQ